MTTFKDLGVRIWSYYKKRRIFVNFVILAIIYLFCCLFEYASPVALVFLSYFVFSEKNYGGYYYLLLSLPFLHILVFAQYVYVLPIVAGAYVIYTFIKAFIVEKGKINWVSVVIFLVVEIYLALPYVNSYDLISFVKMGLVLVLFMFLEFLRQNGKMLNFTYCIYAFMFGFAIGSVFSFLKPFSEVLTNMSVDYTYNGFTRFQGFALHPNSYSLYCIFAMFCPIYLLFNEKYKIFSLAMLAFVVILGLLSFSKTFLVLGSVWILFLIIKFFTISPKKAFIILGVILGILLLSFLFFRSYVVSIFMRFFSSTKFDDIIEFNWSELLTFRDDLWGGYLTAIFQDLNTIFFGFGLSAPKLTGELNPSGLNPHNQYIAIVYKTGIVGFALLGLFVTFMIIQVYKNIKYNKKVDWLTYMLFVVLFMFMFVEDFMF